MSPTPIYLSSCHNEPLLCQNMRPHLKELSKNGKKTDLGQYLDGS